jgi:N-acetylglutamate synthase-like GNAT family acetyltransferase
MVYTNIFHLIMLIFNQVKIGSGEITMSITYSVATYVEAKQVADVFKASGIKRPVEDLERIQRMIDNADVLITALDKDKLVGIARAITDFSYCCYLSDLAVDRQYQRSGIGQALVHQLQETIGDEVALLLLASAEAMNYYPHIGFEKSDNAFRIPRKR